MVPQVVPAPSPLLILPQNSADLVVANAPAAGAGKRGHFIFFVGPLKTGSTYLQGALCTQLARDILVRDGYDFRGICLHPNQTEGVLQRLGKSLQIDVPTSVVPMMNRTRELNGIFVNEYMSLNDHINSSYVTLLAQAVENSRFARSTIVVSYRRFFEQYLSNFNQIQRPKKGNLGWPRELIGDADAKPFQTPGRLCTSDTNETDLLYRIFCLHNASRAQVYRDLYSQSFDSVKVMDMHDITDRSKYEAAGDPYLQQFLCHTVPDTPRACAAAREGRIGVSEHRNPSIPLHYDSIAVEAWKQGLFGCNGMLMKKTRLKRREAYNEIRDRQEKHLNLTWKDLPLTCPSTSELEEFLQTSLAYERQLFPKSWRSRQADHESAFWNAFVNFKFCSINATTVLHNIKWRQFLYSLGSKKKCGRGQGLLTVTNDLNKNSSVSMQ